MKRTIRVTRIVEFELDIPDFTLSNDEISKLVESKIDDYIDEVYDEDWEFEGPAPKTTEQQPEPPEHCWITVGNERWASNGHIAIAESCPIRPAITRGWLQATPGLLETINTRLLTDDWRNMPPHTGIFDSDLAGGFRSLANLKAVGKDAKSPAYLVHGDKLIAIVMPKHRRSLESDFHFNQP